jgi:hypothetical protein
MRLIDSTGAVPAMPAPSPAGQVGWFAQVTPGQGVPTVVSVDWLNSQQAEPANVVLAAGITPNAAQFAQLRDAILALGAFTDTGAANAYAISTAVPAKGVPAIEAPVIGTGFLILAKTANTGPSFLTVDGNPAAPWVNNAGGQLSPGDIQGGTVYPVRFDGANYRMLGVTNEQVAILVGDAVAGNIQASTQPAGTDNNELATTAFVFNANNGVAPVNVAGNSNVALTQPQWGLGILALTGAVTAAITLDFPAGISGRWVVWNNATGAFPITATTGSGSTTILPQGAAILVMSDGTNIVAASAVGMNRRIPVQTVANNGFSAVVGGDYPTDTTGGAFGCNLPASANYGDAIAFSDIAGTWLTNPFTINGTNIEGGGISLICNLNRFSFNLVYRGATYGWKAE